MNDHLLPRHRRPVVIADSKLRAGGASARVKGDDPEALLRQYLRLIRRVRNQQRDRSVALRRADITTLAEHLGWTDAEVLARLADLMGATRRQRAAMLTILATGASLITVAGPLDASVTASVDATDGRSTDDPVVVLSDHLATDDRPSAEHAARLVLSDEPVIRAAGVRSDRTARHAPVLDAQQRRETPPATAQIDLEQRADAPLAEAPTPDVTPPAPELPRLTQAEPTSSDDALEPPTVAVGEPPVPPATATDNEGNTVAVGEPPVPPATATDNEGNTVAVGEPPVPPTPPAASVEQPAPVEPPPAHSGDA